MGDIRYTGPYHRVSEARDRVGAIRALSDEDVVAALAAASLEHDAYLANVLASEAMNRVRWKETVFATAGEGLCLLDADGRLRYLNPAAERLLGWSQDELVGERFHDLVHYQDLTGVQVPWDECAVKRACFEWGETASSDDDVFARADGSLFPVSYTAAPVEREGEVEGAVIVFRDITDRKRDEHYRAASHEVIEILATSDTVEEAAPRLLQVVGEAFRWDAGAMWLLDEPAGVLRCQHFWHATGSEVPHFEQATRTATLPLGQGFPGVARETQRPAWATDFRTLPPERFPRVGAAMEDGLRGAFALPCPAGRAPLAVLEFMSREPREPGDRLLERAEAIGSHIAHFIERKQAEANLRGSEARKAGIVHAALDAIITIDDESRIIEWNPAAERILGWSRDEAVGRDLAELVIPERYRQAHRAGLMRYLETGEGPMLGTRVELPATRKDGTEFPCELSIVSIRTNGHRLFTGFLRDVTQQKLAEREREEALGREREARARAERAEHNLRFSEARTRRVLEATLGGHALRHAASRPLESAETETEERLADPVPTAHHEGRTHWWPRLKQAFLGDINEEYAEAMGYPAVDRFALQVLLVNWAVLALLALGNSVFALPARFPSPFGWRVLSLPEALGVVLLGGAATAIPLLTKDRLRSHYRWRLLTTACLTGFSYLFVFTTGGSIEAHFHFFMVLAFIVIWADWRLGWMVLGLTLLHHALLDAVRPGWVFFYGENALSAVAHGVPVLATVLFTSVLCKTQRDTVKALESARTVLVEDVAERRRAEGALRESEARYASLFDSIRDAIVVTSPDRTIMAANPAFTDLTGYTLAEVRGRTSEFLYVARKDFETMGRLARENAGRVPTFTREVTWRKKGGEPCPVEITVSYMRDAEGNVEAYIGVVRDVSQRKRTEEGLREREARYRMLVESVTDYAIFMLDPQGRILTWNEGAKRLEGYEAQEVIGKPYRLLYPPDTRATGNPQRGLEIAEREGRYEEEGWRVRKDGTRFWAEVRLTAVRDDTGRLRGFSNVTRDATARHEVEGEAQRLNADLKRRVLEAEAARERLHDLFRQAPAAIAIVDGPDYVFSFVNKIYEALVGLDASHLLGRPAGEALPELVEQGFIQLLDRVRETGEPFQVEATPVAYTDAGGARTRYYNFVYEPVLDDNRRVGRIMGIAVDVTAQVEAQKAARELAATLDRRVQERTRALTAANQELEAFTYLVSHDLKEPVRAVEAYLAALQEDYHDALPREAQDILRAAHTSTRRLDALVKGLLDLSRAGRLADTTQPVNFLEAVESIECSTRYERLLEQRQGTLEVQADGALWVRGTPSALCQVLGNLILNGLVHNPGSHPRVRVRTAETPIEDGLVEAVVEDNGPGFSEEAIQRFNDAASSTSIPSMHRLEGGFGLLIARRTVERLGGRMWIGRSSLGGAAVHLALPMAEPPEGAAG